MTAEVDQLIAYHRASGAPGVLTDINTPRVHSATSAHYARGNCSTPQPKDHSDGCTGCATDWAFYPPQQMTAALRSIFDHFVPIEMLLWELFYEGAPYWIKNGKRVSKMEFPTALRNQHRNHVHVAIRKGIVLPIPQFKPPLPAVTPAVIGPIIQHGDVMQSQIFTTATLDEHGNGYIDTRIPADKFVCLVPLGPSPDRDGYGWPNWYWSMNDTNGQARIEIEGGEPRKPVGFIAWQVD